MNKLLKYGGYLVAFIVFLLVFGFLLLMILDKMGVGCLFWCYEDKGPIVQNEDRYYVDGKRVK